MASGAEQEGNEAGQPHCSVCSHGCAGLDAAMFAKNTRCDDLHEKESKFTSRVKFGCNTLTFKCEGSGFSQGLSRWSLHVLLSVWLFEGGREKGMIEGWMDAWMDAYGCIDGRWMHGWMEGGMYEWMHDG